MYGKDPYPVDHPKHKNIIRDSLVSTPPSEQNNGEIALKEITNY